MNGGVAVNLARGGLKNAAMQALCKPEHVYGAVHRCLCCLHRIMLIVDRRSRASEIVDFVRLHVERKRDVMTEKLEARMGMEMLHVAFRAGEQVVDAEHLVPLLQQAIDQVRSEEAGAPRYE